MNTSEHDSFYEAATEPTQPIMSSSSEDDSWDDYYQAQQLAELRFPDENGVGSSRLSAIFLIINAALGASLLNYPEAFGQAGGIISASFAQAFFLTWIVGALFILVCCADKVGAATLQELLKDVCGNTGLISCSLIVAVYCFGSCVSCLTTSADQFYQVFHHFGSSFSYGGFLTTYLLSIYLILPFSFSRRIDFVRLVSPIGVIAALYVVGLIVYNYWMGNNIPGPIKTFPTSWTDVFMVVPAICSGYQCHVSIIPIYKCLKQRNLTNFSLVCLSAMMFCTAMYTFMGIFGYLTFGSLVDSDILESFGEKNPFVIIGLVAVAIKTITMYPLLLFCGREALIDIFHYLKPTYPYFTVFGRRCSTTLAWYHLSYAIAMLFPEIANFTNVLSAIFIFVFPGLCLLQSTLRCDPTFYRKKNTFYVIIAIAFIIFGSFVFGVVLTQAVERFADISKT